MEIISLDNVFKTLRKVDDAGNPVPCSLTIVTCDLSRKRGGERINYTNAVLCNKVGGDWIFHLNATINIKGKGNNEVRSINPLLITHCNGKEVSL